VTRVSGSVTKWLTRRATLSGLSGVVLLHVTGCTSSAQAGRFGTDSRIGAAKRGPVESRGAPRSARDTEATEAVPVNEQPRPQAAVLPELALPPRPVGAESGSAFLRRLEGMGRGAIDDQVIAAITIGNVPQHLRKLAAVELSQDGVVRGRLFVTKDYLAIGSDDDFMRMPMTSAAAQKIADLLDATLPTPRIVDLIYEQAAVRLPPSYIDGGPTDDSLVDFQVHQAKLESRRKAGNYPLDALTAGHKKDIVLSTRLAERDDRVAIYGWHKKRGDVIQSLSCKHSCRYADYSHGVRIVAQAMTLDGKQRRVSDVLADSDEASLLSDEGPLPILVYSTELPQYAPPAKKKRAK